MAGVDRGPLLKVVTPYLEECEAIWFYRKINVAEFLQLGGFIDLKTGDVDLAVMVDAVLICARKEDGTRLWGEPHRARILDWDPVWLIRLTTEMAILDQLRIDDPKT